MKRFTFYIFLKFAILQSVKQKVELTFVLRFYYCVDLRNSSKNSSLHFSLESKWTGRVKEGGHLCQSHFIIGPQLGFRGNG